MLTPLSIAISLPYALVRPSGSRLIMTCSCYRWKQPLVERNCRELLALCTVVARLRHLLAGLRNVPGLELLPWTDGASYAIYAVRLQQLAQRQHVLKSMRQTVCKEIRY